MQSKERIYKTEILIPAELPKVFEFFADAHNLERITPPWLNFQVLDQSTPRITEGTVFNYRLKVKGFPVKWRSKIIQWEDQKQFMDIQLKGPYKKWEHLHRFQEKDGGTWMEDIVHYELPFGLLGDFFGGWMVENDVRKIFEYRAETITEIFRNEK